MRYLFLLAIMAVCSGALSAQSVTPGFGTGAGQWAAGNNTLTLSNENTSFTFSGNPWSIGASGTVDITPTFGTSANNFAMGSKTVALVNGDGSFTFSAAKPIGANVTIGITPTWGTGAGTFCQGNDVRLSGAGQAGTFSMSSGALTTTITLPTPITTTYSAVTTLVSPVTIATVSTMRSTSFDVTLEWNASGARGNWVALKY